MITDKLAKVRLRVMSIEARTYSCLHDGNILFRGDCRHCIIEAEKAYNKKAAHLAHIDNVLATCKRLDCTPGELLKIDYQKILRGEMAFLKARKTPTSPFNPNDFLIE